MQIYDGSNDKKVSATNHTAAPVSCDKISVGLHDSMTIRKNGREDWSLFYCETGKMYFDSIIIYPGEIWIYEPFAPQKYVIYSADNTTYRYLHFTGSDIAALLSSLNISAQKPIKCGDKFPKEIFNRLKEEISNNDTVSVLKAECLIIKLLLNIADISSGCRETNIMKRVIDNMEHSFSGEYDALKFAGMLNISVHRFNHLFKEVVGVSPHAYFNSLKIENACRLLENTDMKIKEISECSGYKDPLYFTQAFKNQKGVTPMVYRKLHTENLV